MNPGRLKHQLTTLLVAISSACVQLVTAVAGLLVARGMQPSEYGEVAYFMSVFSTLELLAAMGIRTQVTRDVARLVGAGKLHESGEVIGPLLIARLTTLVPVGLLALVFTLRGDGIGSAAAGVAVLMSVGTFLLGVTQALGHPRLVAAIQLGQSVLYLAVIASWGRFSPERVFSSVALSYGACLVAAGASCVALVPSWRFTWQDIRGRWRGFLSFSSQAYAISLLLAPYGSLAVLALGWSGRFDDAAQFGVALPLALIVPTALNMVVGVQYYPRLCQLLGSNQGEASEWIDTFYRLFAVAGIAVAAGLAVFPEQAIGLLFTDKYVAAASSARVLAAAVVPVTLGQLLVWTLVGYGKMKPALLGGAVQLLVLVAAIGVCVALPGTPLWALAIGQTTAAVAGLALWGAALRGSVARYSWHGARLGLALLATLAVCLTMREVIGGMEVNAIMKGGLLASAGAACLALATPIMLLQPSRRPVLAPGNVSSFE
ncbi:MAG: oligosaccharide flippase family protein [Chloroflexi bacterium]|nr:oligosaccharide flippase family protein [Chloroflexota bacterium]